MTLEILSTLTGSTFSVILVLILFTLVADFAKLSGIPTVVNSGRKAYIQSRVLSLKNKVFTVLSLLRISILSSALETWIRVFPYIQSLNSLVSLLIESEAAIRSVRVPGTKKISLFSVPFG